MKAKKMAEMTAKKLRRIEMALLPPVARGGGWLGSFWRDWRRTPAMAASRLFTLNDAECRVILDILDAAAAREDAALKDAEG